LWIITLLIIIGGLSYIYSKSDKEEENIIFKIIGYFFLGAFLFRFNEFPIPLGFLVFLIFFKPIVNKVAKTRAAYLGLLVLFIGIISPMVSNYYFERPVEVVASSSNIYMLDTKEDWQKIQEKIGYPRDLKIEDFRVNYEEDGQIRDFRYDLVGYLENEIILYRVKLLPDKQVYSINAIKIDQWAQYGRLVIADRFFEALEKVNLKEVVNQEKKLEWYVVASRGEYITSVEDATHFMYEEGKMTRVDNSDLPISGFYISLYGMRQISKTSTSESYEGSNVINFWFQQW